MSSPRSGMTRLVVSGRGLHGGKNADVQLRASGSNPVTLWVADQHVALPGCAVTDAFRSTTIAVGMASVRTVEHLAAALFGLGITRGLSITVSGEELPLLDGGALAWVAALRDAIDANVLLGAAGSGEHARIARAATLRDGDASYGFTPAEDTRLSVRVDLGDPRYDRAAAWDGTAAAFEREVAPARTFSREEDVMELLERGVAAWVPRESVVVLCKERPALFHGRPFADDEPARHKLLDLIGDVYVRCGVLRGHVHAERPGHARTHAILTRALVEGVIVRESARS
jgi:UDP-3-O-[3-hydroxymyristoyl] N-acetylglucosamine deacetylase